MTAKNKSFRQDINGLRAWAVVAVILYHFGITGFSGGFVGVDVFFVISGFLMTGIIGSGLEKYSRVEMAKPFSVIDFYLSRARRIIPALLVLCLAVMISGWFFLSVEEYKTLSADAISALGFFSNINFWHGVDYFETSSHDRLLLHTWSLSVEWQFYLILPLFLLVAWRLRPGRAPLIIMITLALMLSLLLSITLSPIMPVAAFYLLPTRAWEMLSGGLVYFLANPLPLSARVKAVFEVSGFALIIAAVMLFNADSSWPGWRALVPVVGSMLVLVAARQGSLWSGTRPAQWLGDCSYSLYLWHWPLVVGLGYLQRQDNAVAIVVGLALTALLGGLSYRFVETPARTALGAMPKWRGAGVLLVATLVVALPMVLIFLDQGVPGRLPAQIEAVFNESMNVDPRRGECLVDESRHVPECTYGGNKLGAIVIGDSHAAAVIRSVEKALPDRNLYILGWTVIDCPTIAGVKRTYNSNRGCGEFVKQALSKQKKIPGNIPVIIVSRMSRYTSGPNEKNNIDELPPSFYVSSPYRHRNAAFLQEMREGVIRTACEFAATRPVYMVRPIPELKINVPTFMGRGLILGTPREVSVSLAEYREREAFAWETQDMAAKRCGVKILDPLPYLCRDGRCWGDINGLPVYSDDDHLNERGGGLLIPMFRRVFEDLAESYDGHSTHGMPSVGNHSGP
ncbi:MAG: acyltransferase family protein [bacterium]|nr:acyltransferase family protein [bacterium]